MCNRSPDLTITKTVKEKKKYNSAPKIQRTPKLNEFYLYTYVKCKILYVPCSRNRCVYPENSAKNGIIATPFERFSSKIDRLQITSGCS